jgi:hypothetical protein
MERLGAVHPEVRRRTGLSLARTWFLSYMIHNLRTTPAKVYITYDTDFVPETSPAARGITAVHPIWMDVEDRHLYSVSDVHRYSG